MQELHGAFTSFASYGKGAGTNETQVRDDRVRLSWYCTPCVSCRGVVLSLSHSCHVQMDGKNFAKLCKDSGLVSKNLTTVDIDIIFSKVPPLLEHTPWVCIHKLTCLL